MQQDPALYAVKDRIRQSEKAAAKCGAHLTSIGASHFAKQVTEHGGKDVEGLLSRFKEHRPVDLQ
jgi:hypothetical protein